MGQAELLQVMMNLCKPTSDLSKPSGVPSVFPEDTKLSPSTLQVVPNLPSGGGAGQAELLQVMMKLCTTIEGMGKKQEATSAALISGINEVKQNAISNTYPGILKTPAGQDTSLGHAQHQLSRDKETYILPTTTSRKNRDYNEDTNDKVSPSPIREECH